MRGWASVMLATVLLAGCDAGETQAEPPAPHELTSEAVGYYDRMIVVNHKGPKAQILLESRDDPIWFSSVRDGFAFAMLPEEPRDIAAFYVTDMSRAESWATPGPGTWVEAEDAVYVIGSDRRGGMGAEEPVPFGSEEAARDFAAEHGGDVVAYDGVPEDYVLGPTDASAGPQLKEGAHDME